MIWAFRQLLVPMNYLRIRHGSGWLRSKRFYDVLLPLALSILTMFGFWYLKLSFSLYAHTELIKRLSDLLALMIVFYMAALAAVATFDRKGIDDQMPDHQAHLWIRNPEGGQWRDEALSYRRFISYLFGYLSFLSLCLYMFIQLFSVGWQAFETHFEHVANFHAALTIVIDPLIFLLTFFAVWQLFVTSLLGIYFLTERIQTLNNSGQ